MIKILELFGGIGAARIALRNIGIPVKAIDYVEINIKAVMSYNAMFKHDLKYRPQDIVGYTLKPDILIHGSPCQDFSIAGHQGAATGKDRINKGKGGNKGSGTRSSLMWETIRIIEELGDWKPQIVIWENVKNVVSKHMIDNFNLYLAEMERLGYTNNYETLDARDFGLPQARERVFTISCLHGQKFDFEKIERRKMRNIQEFLQDEFSEAHKVTQSSILDVIGEKGIKRATVISDYAYTITERQDRAPAQIIDLGNDEYRYLTELECWRLQGYTDEDYYNALSANPGAPGRMNRTMYRQSGNSIPVPIFESIFKSIITEYQLDDQQPEQLMMNVG